MTRPDCLAEAIVIAAKADPLMIQTEGATRSLDASCPGLVSPHAELRVRYGSSALPSTPIHAPAKSSARPSEAQTCGFAGCRKERPSHHSGSRSNRHATSLGTTGLPVSC